MLINPSMKTSLSFTNKKISCVSSEITLCPRCFLWRTLMGEDQTNGSCTWIGCCDNKLWLSYPERWSVLKGWIRCRRLCGRTGEGYWCLRRARPIFQASTRQREHMWLLQPVWWCDSELLLSASGRLQNTDHWNEASDKERLLSFVFVFTTRESLKVDSSRFSWQNKRSIWAWNWVQEKITLIHWKFSSLQFL